jgi:hypothetical protein
MFRLLRLFEDRTAKLMATATVDGSSTRSGGARRRSLTTPSFLSLSLRLDQTQRISSMGPSKVLALLSPKDQEL